MRFEGDKKGVGVALPVFMPLLNAPGEDGPPKLAPYPTAPPPGLLLPLLYWSIEEERGMWKAVGLPPDEDELDEAVPDELLLLRDG